MLRWFNDRRQAFCLAAIGFYFQAFTDTAHDDRSALGPPLAFAFRFVRRPNRFDQDQSSLRSKFVAAALLLAFVVAVEGGVGFKRACVPREGLKRL